MNHAATTMKTLLQREWMQHRRGWLILSVLPVALLAIALSFGNVRLGDGGVDRSHATAAAALLGLGALAATLALMWIAVLLQAPGLARRDVQDRSIEFWLSLPTPPAASVGATLLTHLVLVPWAAIGIGLLAAALIGPAAVVKTFGFGALTEVEWASLVGTGLALALRLLVGVLLFTLWLSPIILGLMVASAWLKRWGVPAVIGALAVGGALEQLVFGSKLVYNGIDWLFSQGVVGLIGASAAARGGDPGIVINEPSDIAPALNHAIAWCFEDLAVALGNLAQPGFGAALALGGVMFGLLVWRRQRGG